jgi:hypothetical protein
MCPMRKDWEKIRIGSVGQTPAPHDGLTLRDLAQALIDHRPSLLYTVIILALFLVSVKGAWAQVSMYPVVRSRQHFNTHREALCS